MRATVSFPILAPDLDDATDEEPVSKRGGVVGCEGEISDVVASNRRVVKVSRRIWKASKRASFLKKKKWEMEIAIGHTTPL